MKLVFALLLAAVPIGAAAAAPGQDKAKEARLVTASAMIEAVSGKQAQKAVELATSLLDDYGRLHARETRTLLCDADEPETAAYAAMPGGKDARIVEGTWCMALWTKGYALIELAQLDAAVPYLERAVAMAPLHPHYLSELGYAYQSQKRWQLSYDVYARAADAAARFQTGGRRDKSLRRAWFGMGYDMIELGKLDQAEALFRKCLEIDPSDEKIRGELDYIADRRARKQG